MNTAKAKFANSISNGPDANRVAVEKAADALAKPMFCLSLLFLFLLAGLVVTWVDVLPDAVEQDAMVAAQSTDQLTLEYWKHPAIQTGYVLFKTLMLIWPLFLVEAVYVRWLAKGQAASVKSKSAFDWFCVACPPLRLGKSIPGKNGKIWLPRMGWRTPGKELHEELMRIFSTPMLIIALLILPVLLIEFRYQELLQSTLWLKLLLSVCMGLIWCAFACEFILMVSTTKKKLGYVKKNWIDLAIILLPLVSFLRSLRIVRAAKLARFAKLQQLTKMGRIYRLRGLLAKTIRAFLVLDLVHRIMKTKPEKRLEKLLAQMEDKQSELRDLQQRVAEVRAELASQEVRETAA